MSRTKRGHLGRATQVEDVDHALIRTLEHLGALGGLLVARMPDGRSPMSYARHPSSTEPKARAYQQMIDILQTETIPWLKRRLAESLE